MRIMSFVLITLVISMLIVGAVACETDINVTPAPAETATPALVLDSDGDGWADDQEQMAGTDPQNADTDGDGYWDPLDPNPLDSDIPLVVTTTTPAPSNAETPAPSITAPPVPAPTGTPAPSWTPSQLLYKETIPDEILEECALQFLMENEAVTQAFAYQSTDATTLFLTFAVFWETMVEDAKMLAESYVRFVKSRVDVPPGVEIGTGEYDYVTYAIYQGGLLKFQGKKCATCDAITWY